MIEVVEKPDYGNWVSKKFLYVPGVLGVFFLVISWLVSLLVIFAFLFFIIMAYFTYARYLFSPNGGNLQSQIQDLVLDRLDWDGNGKKLILGVETQLLQLKPPRNFPMRRLLELIIGAGCGIIQRGFVKTMPTLKV
jgi:hypothetical protein